MSTNDGFWWVQMIGRTRDAETAARSMADLLRAMVRERSPQYPTIADIRVEMLPGARGLDESRSAYRMPIFLVGGILVVLFALACMNVASLLLAKAVRRQREIATRLALGASRLRIARQLVIEATLFTSAGAGLGLFFSPALTALMLRILPRPASRIGIDVSIDGRIALFVLGVALLSGILLGLLPAIRGTTAAGGELHASHHATSKRSTMARVLVSMQVALSSHASRNQRGSGAKPPTDRSDRPRLRPPERAAVRYSPDGSTVPDDMRLEMSMRIREAVESIPGVERVAMSSHGVLTGQSMMKSIDRADHQAPHRFIWINVVDPSFLDTMRIALIRGRGIQPSDSAGAPPVAVVNVTAVKKYLAAGDPLGQTISMSGTAVTVIGVVKDAKYTKVRSESMPVAYLPMAQFKDRIGAMTFDLRTSVPPATIAPVIREAVHRIDPDTPVLDLASESALVARSTEQERATAQLASVFGLLAALLASIGLFGLMSFLVAGRTIETGIRMALGAERGRVLRGVLAEAMAVVLPGVAIGIPATFMAGRLLQSILYEVSPYDPTSMASAAFLMMAVAIFASAIPAWRAATVDPVIALRSE